MQRPVKTRYDSRRQCSVKAEWIAESEDLLTDDKLIRSAQCNDGQFSAIGIELNKSNIIFRIYPDDCGGENAVVKE